jgi:exosortase/archaeosortase family protein
MAASCNLCQHAEQPHMTDAGRYALRAVAASLTFFGILRLTWVESHLLIPVTRVQGAAAASLFGNSPVPVEVTLACSGADAMALCLAAILVYPVRWGFRLTGASLGIAIILLLNVLRISTLGRAAGDARVFNALHLYIWPAVLSMAIAGYVFAWIGIVDGARPLTADTPVPRGPSSRLRPSARFARLTVIFLLLFAVASPLYLESAAVLALGAFIAAAAAAVLGVATAEAHATGNILWTTRGGFSVTQECISTPLIPVYLAAVVAYASTWRRWIPGVLLVVPLFVGLGIVRLLIVALPVPSPLFFVHAFYQVLLAAVVVSIAAAWRHGRRNAPRHAVAGIALGTAFVVLLGPVYTQGFAYLGASALDDPQGALAFLPAFQVGLYLALCAAAFSAVGWRRLTLGLGALAFIQTAGTLALQALATHVGWMASTREARGWAIAGPLLILAAVIGGHRARR